MRCRFLLRLCRCLISCCAHFTHFMRRGLSEQRRELQNPGAGIGLGLVRLRCWNQSAHPHGSNLGFLPVLQFTLWAQVAISTILVILAALRLPEPSTWPALAASMCDRTFGRQNFVFFRQFLHLFLYGHVVRVHRSVVQAIQRFDSQLHLIDLLSLLHCHFCSCSCMCGGCSQVRHPRGRMQMMRVRVA